MDFVVIGLGLSALALLTGLSLLCMVAPRWFRKSRAVQPADAAYAQALAGQRHALGQGFLCVGAVLLLTTLGGISAGLADQAGAYLVAAITTVAVLGLFGWDLLYRKQHPVPQRRRVASARAKPAAAEPTTSVPSTSPEGSPAVTATTVRRRVLPARRRAMPAPQPATLAAVVPVPVEPVSEGERPLEDALIGVAEAAASPDLASSEAEPELDDVEPVTATGSPDDLPSPVTEETEEPVREEPLAGEPAVVAVELPEPVPFPSAQTNGAADPAIPPPPETEPNIHLDGDDRVIALFPTAAARRSRMATAPPDPDGKS